MSREFRGQLHIRVPEELHKELARESFETGVSMSSLCSQALLIRRALKGMDPWKSVVEVWEANAGVGVEQLENDVEEAIRAVRSTKPRSRKREP